MIKSSIIIVKVEVFGGHHPKNPRLEYLYRSLLVKFLSINSN